ncbi:hypothetical protein B1729_14935 [Microbacterium sp. B35-04]|uniref:DUF2306 domain-containing protein n=1 Tax=unclassified Microbacterium TaxID=2609290 RepID=UPI0013D31D08|nr:MULTISPECIES: DUF2306 domain-containing protein [unclassified Microbacterium]KAF2412482.1 hypothetical protein B1729_14935 [Microbacterium sp. B35-04]KAF2417977.1 hypothetical protein B2K11_10915 [Microbacterium sp. B35-30]
MTRLIEPVRTAPAVARPGGIRSRIGWTFVLLTALAIVAYSALPYFTASLADLAGQEVGLAPTYATVHPFVQGALYVHIVGGAVALVTGPLQFWRGLRTRAPRVHRWTGRVYLVAVAIGAAGGLVIAPSSPAGYVGFFGFGTLAVLWLVTGWRAYRAIRRGDVPSHRAWMIRNYALTYSGVMLRIWLPFLLFAPVALGQPLHDGSFANAYAAVPFLCWLPNLVFAEWLIRRRGLPSYRLPV